MASLSCTRQRLASSIRHTTTLTSSTTICTRKFSSISTSFSPLKPKSTKRQTPPLQCWNISCRYYSKKRDDEGQYMENGDQHRHRNRTVRDQANARKSDTFSESASEEDLKTSEEEFMKYKEELVVEQQLLNEVKTAEEDSELGLVPEPEPMIEIAEEQQEPAPHPPNASLANCLVLRNTPPHCLLVDIQRAFLARYGIQPPVYNYVAPQNHTEVAWLVEFESPEQANAILRDKSINIGLYRGQLLPCNLQTLPPKYEGKAVFISNLSYDVTIGDVAGFLQDFGILSIENYGDQRGKFIVTVDSTDAAEAIKLMYHNYQYGNRLMEVYQLY